MTLIQLFCLESYRIGNAYAIMYSSLPGRRQASWLSHVPILYELTK